MQASAATMPPIAPAASDSGLTCSVSAVVPTASTHHVRRPVIKSAAYATAPSVPMALPIRNAKRAFYTFMISLTAVFVVLFIILNIMMSVLIVRPITRMSAAANDISTGNMDIPEFSEKGGDEVTLLAKSFNRMRRSLEKAIELIEKK